MLPITCLKGIPTKFHLPLLLGGGAYTFATSHRFFEVMSAFTMFDEYFLKDLGNDQAIWAWHPRVSHGCLCPITKVQITTHNCPPFPLKRASGKKQHGGTHVQHAEFELLSLSFFLVSILKPLAKSLDTYQNSSATQR